MHRTRSALLTLSLALWGPAALAADVTVTLPAGDGFVVKDNAASVERLRVDEATGNVSRNGALFVHTTGSGSTFVGEAAGNLSTTGSGNSAFGWIALASNTMGNSNSAFGRSALNSNTAGNDNSAFGRSALNSNTMGTGNSAFGRSALFGNTTGNYNSAFGWIALASNTMGNSNSAFGRSALGSNTAGNDNSAFGRQALRSNTTGASNVAVGRGALGDNNASYNVAVGRDALADNSSGQTNVAVGSEALFRSTGSGNAALGNQAGANLVTGSNNIYIANLGVSTESGQIKIGRVGTHTQATLAGIHNNTSSGGIAVLVNASGTLGTSTSSARFKQDVQAMGEASEPVMALRPVTFRYRADPAVRQYGLIAEEVAEVAPELVAPDADGKPYSVRYHVLAPMLLNELQKQQSSLGAQQDTIRGLLARVEQLEAQLVAAGEGVGR